MTRNRGACSQCAHAPYPSLIIPGGAVKNLGVLKISIPVRAGLGLESPVPALYTKHEQPAWPGTQLPLQQGTRSAMQPLLK